MIEKSGFWAWMTSRSERKEGNAKAGIAYVVVTVVVLAFIVSEPARAFFEFTTGTAYDPNDQWMAALITMANMGFGALIAVISNRYKSADGRALATRIRPVCDECPLHEWTGSDKKGK